MKIDKYVPRAYYFHSSGLKLCLIRLKYVPATKKKKRKNMIKTIFETFKMRIRASVLFVALEKNKNTRRWKRL